MKKVIWLVAAAVSLAALLSFVGCGGSTTGNSSNKNSTGDVSEAELGVPIYPGATKEDLAADRPTPGPGTSAFQSGGNRPNWNEQSSTTGSMPRRLVAFWTPDSVDKVTAWYKEKLSGKTGFSEATSPFRGGSEPGEVPATYSFKSGDNTKIVMIREDTSNHGNGTTIMVGDAPEGMPSGPPVNQSQ